MIWVSLGITALFGVGLLLAMGLTPRKMAEEIMEFLKPRETLKSRVHTARQERQKRSLYRKIMGIRSNMDRAGTGAKFTLVIIAAGILVAMAVLFCFAINNYWLIPVMVVAAAILPFALANRSAEHYNKRIRDELEIAMSLITNSYMRREDLTGSITENLPYIKNPLRKFFERYVGEVNAVSSNTKLALLRLKKSVDDPIFEEWVDALIVCQDNRTMKGTLQPIIHKISELRLINNDLKTAIYSARMEYWIMVALCFANVPILKMLNDDWLNTLLFTTAGKIVYSICLAVILITTILMFRFTKEVEYKG